MTDTPYHRGNSPLSSLIGQTIVDISGLNKGSEDVTFMLDNGDMYRLHYEQDCCAGCSIEQIDGDVDDLLNSPVLMSECVTNQKDDVYGGSETWSFYKFATNKGYVTVRWYGSSNGYYSEECTFNKMG